MKNVIFLIFACLILGCEKENGLTSQIELENLYEIKDDPTDPVKHRVYEIYNKYGVPVYFNDTIGKVFVKKDVSGKDVYRYEVLDLAWGFTSYSRVTYMYDYLINPEEQLVALGIIEKYLELSTKPLYPFSFFVTKSAKIIDAQDKEKIYEKGDYTINYRTLLMTGDWTGEQIISLPGNIRREMVKNKILNYKDLLAVFNEVSDRIWYGQYWTKLDVNWYNYVDGTKWPRYYFDPSALSDSWFGCKEMEPDELQEFRGKVRAAIGQFGFVSGGRFTSLSSPEDSEDDLIGYISEMLNYTREEFEQTWGNSPLVMEKYEILYDIVANKLGVEL